MVPVFWLLLIACASLALGPQSAAGQAADVPYVPTPMNVVEAMLDLAKVGPNDFVIDLGSGDGRILIAAAKKYGARGLGVELDGALVNDARREAKRQGVENRVSFAAENLFTTDIGQATVVTAYLFPRVNMELRPRIFAQLKPGSRLVSHEFDFGNWKPDAQMTVPVPNKPYGPPHSEVFLWIVPANAAGRWRWRSAFAGVPLEVEVALEQTFQELRGAALVDSRPARLENPRLRGDEIRLTLIADVNGRAIRQELAGRIDGDAIRGKQRAPNAESGMEWQATRVSRGKINIDAAGAMPSLAHESAKRGHT
jgi:hypothetical protein